MKKPVAMTIAGIDTGNGAGAEADVKTFEVFGIHGVLVVTAITAQSTKGVFGILPTDPEFLRKQIQVLKDDFNISGVKVGMIYTKEQFKVYKEEISDIKVKVVDPVIYAKDGTQLIKDVDEYKELVLKDSTVITPNAVEASILSGVKINSLEDMKSSARKLKEMYNVDYVVVKGGHLQGDYSYDLLYGDDLEYYIGYPRLKEKNTHGTGSVFASSLLSGLVKGYDIKYAFSTAKAIVYNAIRDSLAIGKGIGPIDPFVDVERSAMKYKVIQDMIKFADFVESKAGFYKLIPEVQSNLAHSIDPSYVRGLQDIATYRGRIIRRWDTKVIVNHPPVFGNPTHTARLLLSIISKGVNADSLINIRYDEKHITCLKEYGLDVIEVNREIEPEVREGTSMEWIINYVSENYGKIPNVIYDKGKKGKEAMIRIWSSNIEELIDILDSLVDCNS
ncbi:MAG: bifunctional hydroxymethylpyrimidine kinase/phosphomethylpyrimidine kinase [Sulfolobaceae archaeon]|nr:bifunctional hydroxymethylpyrimidine kinase/phosphomethylpyrimidine kinase [Sulfolobaceae archaeon]